MQVNELHKFTVTLTASRTLNRKLSSGMVPSSSANPFGSSKDKNEDEQEDITGLQYFKIPVEIS